MKHKVQWSFLVPVKVVYKWYILPIEGLYATYHLLGEPETTIEKFRISSGPLVSSLRPTEMMMIFLGTTIEFSNDENIY